VVYYCTDAHGANMSRKYDEYDYASAMEEVLMNYKVPVCEQCGNTLKGRVPNNTKVICYFCANPRGEQDDDDNKILKSEDKR